MVEVVDKSTGEVREVERIEEALDMVERPPYWRRIGYSAADVGAGEYGVEFRKAFFEAQKEIGPIIEADSFNEFNRSKYTSLGYLLGKVMPILQKHGFSVVHFPGRVNLRSDLNKLAFLPVLIEITHVETGQWRILPFEMPMSKFDAQSIGSAFTYGRRYITEGALGLKSGLDDDGVRASHDMSADDANRMFVSMLKKIEECQTLLDLRTWYKASEQQIILLGEDEAGKLKKAWNKRMVEVKPAVEKRKQNANANTNAEQG